MPYSERRQMFQRRVLPTEEELWDVVMPAAFAAAWYSSLFRMIWNGTTSTANMAVFLLGGILPLSAAFVKGRTVLACRKRRREAISGGRCCRGVIRRVESETVPFTSRNGRIRYRKRYHLVIEKMEEGFACGIEIRTGAYTVPVHLYLKSPEVKLYSDSSGWNWYVEELQCSRFRHDPVVFRTDDADRDTYVGDVVFRVVYFAIAVYLFLLPFWK